MVQFRQAAALTLDAVASINEQVRRLVVRWVAHGGLLCIAVHDRAGLKQLLKGSGGKVKYFDLSDGRLRSLTRREKDQARGLLLTDR